MKKNHKFNLIVFVLFVLCLTAGMLFACNMGGNQTDDGNRSEYFTVSYDAVEGGSIVGDASQTVKYGGNGTEVTAIPYDEYEFYMWSDGKTESTRVETNVVESVTLTAEFIKKEYNIEYTVATGGSIVGETAQCVKYGESGTEVTAVPDEGYVFYMWSDGSTKVTRKETDVKTNMYLTARFSKKEFTVEYIAQEGGSISGRSMQSVKYGEGGISVKAIPDYGYEFVKWSDGNTNFTRKETDVTENKTFTAEFRKSNFSLQYETDGNGTLIGETTQTVEYLGSGTAITAVSSNEMYVFDRWSDGVKTATRTDVGITGNKTVTAEFKKKTFEVKYISENTSIGLLIDTDVNIRSGLFIFLIEYGEDAPHIKATPLANKKDEEYIFLGWSDGVSTLERHDTKITSDVTYTANFGFKIDYLVNGGVGGRIEGNTAQRVLPDETGEEVTAIADEGYSFMGWSDLSWEPTRKDKPDFIYKYNESRHIELIAYFEPNKKTLAYDYGFSDEIPSVAQITLDRSALDKAEFVIPKREGYTFMGWYADRDYRIRITTDTGRYMYGYAVFSLESDTLYARWEKNDARTDNHKILLIFADNVQTTLYSKVIQEDIEISSKMTAPDYELCKWTASTIDNLLNEWFDGRIKFEVDSYYTTKTITDSWKNVDMDYYMFAGDISEVCDVMYLYHNTLTVAGLNDIEHNLIVSFFGISYIKDAFINKDDEWHNYKDSNTRVQEHLEALKSGESDLNWSIIRTCLHELIHTAESYFPRENHYDLHTAQKHAIELYGVSNIENTLKPCLLGEFEIEGEMYCVHMKYWKHDMEINIQYVDRPINGDAVGKIRVVGEEGTPQRSVGRYVPYGSDFSVEAVPNVGYRFVGWSDGVTTAIRHDKNIIAYYRVEAIFEKI